MPAVPFRRSVAGRAALAVVLSSSLLLAACGKSNKSSTTTTAAAGGGATTTTGSTRPALPTKIAQAGVLTAATDASYAPNEFFGPDNKTIEGMDVDLIKAIAAKLGVQAKVQEATFATIIPALGTRYDVGISSFTDNKKREQTVDFVDYFTAGASFMVEKGKNADLTSLDAICGKNVAVEQGTTELDDATAQKKACTDKGKKADTVLAFQDQNGANLALSSGRADVVIADSPVAAYAAKQSNGKFELVGKSYGNAPYGIAIPKSADYKGLTSAIQKALEGLKADGSYDKILAKWGVQGGAISTFGINGATS